MLPTFVKKMVSTEILRKHRHRTKMRESNKINKVRHIILSQNTTTTYLLTFNHTKIPIYLYTIAPKVNKSHKAHFN